jgi:protein O-GlcNAc transferase
VTQTTASRLFLKDRTFDDPATRERALRMLTSYGIPSDRVILRGASSQIEHLAAHGEVDIALDPFPTGGGVTTCEALWMGVPVVTKLGNSVPGRLSGAINSAAGLADWNAADTAAYVTLAVSWASRLDELAALRRSLRDRFVASAVGNAEPYTRCVEMAYRAMWKRWCEAQRSPR